jgi:chemotaxis protein MotB
MKRASGEQKVVVVVKTKKSGTQHHGGSWKVAYADFVTAMMAFFLVMWIVGMDSDVRDLVQGYFNNPVGFRRAFGAGQDPVSQGSTPVPSELQRIPLFVRQVQERSFEAARDRIVRDLMELAETQALAEHVEVVVTAEGLRIELREGPEGATFFDLGSSELRPAARAALGVIARNLGALSNPVVIEGHTDSTPYGSRSYSNWELSVDRANAARRALLSSGLDHGRIREVRGHADRNLRLPDSPFDPSNRRITLLIPYLDPTDHADRASASIEAAAVLERGPMAATRATRTR